MAGRYFGPLTARPSPPLPDRQEPPQPDPRVATVESPGQPIAAIGYKRPDQYDKDDPVFDVIALMLFSGRTGLLYEEMVRDKKISLVARAGATFPDGRYPNLFVFTLAPAQGHTTEENQKALDELVERFKAKKADAETLARVKANARARVISRLDSNAGLASLLATYHASYGNWRKLFTAIDDLNKVTADDVQRVAQTYFIPANRTLVYSVQPQPRGPGDAASGGSRQ
jgi:predicted Zn-dependent peptidase